MIRSDPGVWEDPLFHLAALAAALVGGALALGRGPSDPAATLRHPAGCHACSRNSPDVVGSRDDFLRRTGSIEAPDLAN